MHILLEKSKCINRSKERELCVLFEFRHFLTLRTRLRISKFRVYLCKKNLIDEKSLSD